MPTIHDVATLTSKGQITLPKSVRQVLGAETGSKLVFELKNGQVVISRTDIEHQDPDIAKFLALLAQDIKNGHNINNLPDDLAKTLLNHANNKTVLSNNFDDDVEI